MTRLILLPADRRRRLGPDPPRPLLLSDLDLMVREAGTQQCPESPDLQAPLPLQMKIFSADGRQRCLSASSLYVPLLLDLPTMEVGDRRRRGMKVTCLLAPDPWPKTCPPIRLLRLLDLTSMKIENGRWGMTFTSLLAPDVGSRT